jgi:hypothetical protein
MAYACPECEDDLALTDPITEYAHTRCARGHLWGVVAHDGGLGLRRIWTSAPPRDPQPSEPPDWTSRARALPVPQPEAYLDRKGIAAFMCVHISCIDKWLTEEPPIPSEKWGPSRTSARRFKPSLAVQWARERGGGRP